MKTEIKMLSKLINIFGEYDKIKYERNFIIG